jgi:hypothetical protein
LKQLLAASLAKTWKFRASDAYATVQTKSNTAV